jgi:hypothetical protein
MPSPLSETVLSFPSVKVWHVVIGFSGTTISSLGIGQMLKRSTRDSFSVCYLPHPLSPNPLAILLSSSESPRSTNQQPSSRSRSYYHRMPAGYPRARLHPEVWSCYPWDWDSWDRVVNHREA